MSIRRRLQSVLWRVPVEVEVHEELAHHRELRTQELIDRGWAPDAARAEASRRVAGIEPALRRLGEERNRLFAWREWFDELRQDLRFSFRQVGANPGFSLAAILTLALGLGGTTAIFSVVNAVVLQPFPYDDPDRVLLAYTTMSGRPSNTSVGNFDYIRRRVTTLDQFAASDSSSFNMTEDGNPERVQGLRVTWNYFDVFGVKPMLGRTISSDEDEPGRNRVVVLSNRLWTRRFGADPAIVGRRIRMNAEPYEVVGVLPLTWDSGPDDPELFVPIAFTPAQLAMYDEHYLDLYGRRKTTVTLAQVNDELVRIAQALSQDHPFDNVERSAGARVLGEFVVGNYSQRLWVLLAAVAVVLLIACGNVANLLLARLAARSKELAIRAAIGAGRGRIVRQILTESLVLAGLGGIGGLVVAFWALPVLLAVAPAGVPRLSAATIDGTAVSAALALVMFTAVIVGALPAWQATRRTELREDLGDGKGAANATMKPWIRQVLIATQAALVLTVLTGAALLVRSAINLQQVPLGFDTRGIVTARVSLPGAQYAAPTQVQQTFRQILEGVESAAGVEAAALDSRPPLTGTGGSNGLVPEGWDPQANRIISQSHFVTADYFDTLRIPIEAGRGFSNNDIRQAPLVMILNETLARAAFGDADPIGKRIACCEGSPEAPAWKTVVGVVPDVRARGPAQLPSPEFYLPIAQIPDPAWTWVGRTLSVVVRGSNTATLTTAIRTGVRQADPTLPIFGLQTMDDGMRQILAQARFNTLLMSLLGVTGLVLAGLGIYSVIAWLVTQRSREIGVRMALGASAGDVVSMMTAHGLKPVAIGLALGLTVSLGVTRFLEAQLFQVSARDPLTLVATALGLFTVAVLAAILPAWRATRIDPASSLRD